MDRNNSAVIGGGNDSGGENMWTLNGVNIDGAGVQFRHILYVVLTRGRTMEEYSIQTINRASVGICVCLYLCVCVSSSVHSLTLCQNMGIVSTLATREGFRVSTTRSCSDLWKTNQLLPYNFSDTCHQILNKIGYKIYANPGRKLGSMTRKMQVITGTNGVSRYVVKVS